MRRQLIPDSEGLYLSKSRTDNRCVYSDAAIPEGQHAARLRVSISGNSTGVWIGLGAVDDLADALERFDPDETEPKEELSPTGNVKYNRVRGEKVRCCVCDEHMPEGTIGISHLQSKGMIRYAVWIHVDCRDEVSDGLERVWDYSDELLTEQV